ncbi:MAG: glutathione S-transferase family protein [Sphingopyxis sp.]|nr:glutathione S-transferase family protein [Sphingopyxis sp.]
MLRLLGRASSANVQKVAWLLDEMEIAFTRENYGGEFGGNRSAEYLRLNPNGVVPALVDGDAVIWESNTILRYLANRYGPTPFYPEVPEVRAACECWMDWQLGTLNLCMTPLYIGHVRTPPDQRDEGALERHHARAASLFGILDEALSDRPFLAGSNPTLAEICTAIFAYRWYELALDTRGVNPNLRRWFDAIASRPKFQKHVMIGLS